MSNGQEDTVRHELVIIRARGNDEDAAHHGGVWKIAYADFMTAMMAFFLVMWLINATDEKTLTQVATYFNPIRLSDKATSPKGLHAMDSNSRDQEDPKQQTKEHSQQSRSSTKSDQGKSQHSEDVIFSDPYGTLTKIAAQAEQGPIRSTVGSAKQGEASMTTGEAYRDPFDPQFRQEVTARGGQVKQGGDIGQQAAKGQRSSEGTAEPKIEGQPIEPKPAADERAAAIAPGAASQPPAHPAGEPSATSEQKVVVLNPEQKPGAEGAATTGQPAADGSRPDQSPEQSAPTPEQAREQAREQAPAIEAVPDAARLAELNKQAADKKIAANQKDADQLEKEIEGALDATRLKSIPNIEVKSEAEGVLISLTDQFDFGMFAISSAEPKPEMVVVMEKIAGILASRPEAIIVRGHTDSRVFKSKTYDNWRLSTARAHMAYFMLTRGGIDAKRVERIEGYADRQLKVPSDLGAASNRRIEILLRKASP